MAKFIAALNTPANVHLENLISGATNETNKLEIATTDPSEQQNLYPSLPV